MEKFGNFTYNLASGEQTRQKETSLRNILSVSYNTNQFGNNPARFIRESQIAPIEFLHETKLHRTFYVKPFHFFYHLRIYDINEKWEQQRVLQGQNI